MTSDRRSRHGAPPPSSPRRGDRRPVAGELRTSAVAGVRVHSCGSPANPRSRAQTARPQGSPLQEAKAGEDRRDAALELAITALGFIAGEIEELSRFLALTGIDPGSIRTAAEEPGFLAGVLAYIAGSERTLLAFAAHAGVAPDEIEKARISLAGPDWERNTP